MIEMTEKKIWIIAEQRQGRLAEVSLEAIGKAIDLTEQTRWEVGVVLIGHQLDTLSKQILSYGVQEVLVADEAMLANYCNQAYVKVLEDAVRKFQPEAVLMGATALGTDLAARLAARLRAGLSAHCVDLELNDKGDLFSIIPWLGGNSLCRVSCPSARPQMATVIPGLFQVPKKRGIQGSIIPLKIDIGEEDLSYHIIETKRAKGPKSDLETAEVIVAGGWGIGNNNGWKMIENLAHHLNGTVGATRPAVDESWACEDQMIGTSGLTVRPKLYIGIALSGHPHHLVGVKEPGLTVGINIDPNAPIFESCDIGLVGDYQEIVQQMIKIINAQDGTLKNGKVSD
jgi:electron transfer flavoprotein alpha subunit